MKVKEVGGKHEEEDKKEQKGEKELCFWSAEGN